MNSTIERAITGPLGRLTDAHRARALARLSPAAAGTLGRLIEAQEQLGVLARDVAERRAVAAQRRMRAETYLDKVRKSIGALARRRPEPPRSTLLRGRYQDIATVDYVNHDAPASAAQIAEAETEHAEALAEMAALDERATAYAAQQSRLADALVRYVLDQPGSGLLSAHPDPVEPAPDVDAARETLADLRDAVAATLSAPLPAADALARAKAQIAGLAAAGAPEVLALIESGQPIRWPEIQIQSQGVTREGHINSFHRQFDSLGLFCWVFGDQLVAKIESEIHELADDTNALSAEEKIERESELKAEILALERAEVTACLRLEIRLREDSDPRAVLSLADTLPEPKANYAF